MSDDLGEPPQNDIEMATVLAALADPVRLAIVRTLAEVGEEHCTALGDAAGRQLCKSTLSHHLKVLREAGITHTRVVGTRRMTSLRRVELDSRFPHLIDAVLVDPVREPAAAVR